LLKFAKQCTLIMIWADMYNQIIQNIRSTVIEGCADNIPCNLWREPVIKIISADDERFFSLKETVSAGHLLPCDILDDAKSVICFFIPFKESIVESNVNRKTASTEWASAYVKTNELIQRINDNIEKLMEQNGYKTGKIKATHNFDVEKLISNWSHRHAAYIAGLGTFGINNMLITEYGCCGRLGSIIINCELSEYIKTETPKEKCLNKINGSCGICRRRCVTDSFSDNNFDRYKCYKQCLENAEYHKNTGYADVCGKCLVDLPCSVREP